MIAAEHTIARTDWWPCAWAQHDGLVEVRDKLVARIDEARRNGWLGEVDGLQVSLAGAREKLPNSTNSRATIHLGMPTFPQIAGPPLTTADTQF